MADDPTMPDEQPEEQAATEGTVAGEPTAGAPSEEPTAEEPSTEESAAEPAAGDEPVLAEPVAEESAEQEPVAEAAEQQAAVSEEPAAQGQTSEELSAPQLEAEKESGPTAEDEDAEEEDDEDPAPRVKPAVPGAHLEVDIVPEGVDPLAREAPEDPYAIEDYQDNVAEVDEEIEEEPLPQPISTAAIDLDPAARYCATGKRKTAIARVILKPGSGAYQINGRVLEQHFPRVTLQRNVRQPLETVGYEDRMDVVARLHGGGVSAQAGALRHGISRALLEADPNLRGELKRRGFLTRDSRAKERKKAGLKKARKRPQFSKR